MRERHLLRTLIAVSLAWAGGCFLMHSPEDDSRSDTDAGWPSIDASADGPCGLVGGYAPCDGECELDCRDLGRLFCSDPAGVCYPFDTVEEHRGNDICQINYYDDPSLVYCWSGNICASRPQPDFTEESFAGHCVRPEYCDEVVDSDIGAECRYSDGSVYVDGPPEVEECPPGGNPLTPFCGGPCSPDGCPLTAPPHNPYGSYYYISCVGMSETRGIGVCAIATHRGCRPEDEGIMEGCELYWGQPCLCLVVRDEDGPREWGWPTMADSCRAYRDMYPGDFDCFDAEWTRVD